MSKFFINFRKYCFVNLNKILLIKTLFDIKSFTIFLNCYFHIKCLLIKNLYEHSPKILAILELQQFDLKPN